MRNSDPGVRIVSVQRHNSNLNSMFTVQVTGCNFQYGSNFDVPLDPSFWLWCSFFSWNSVFTTGHCIELCQITSVLRHEVLSFLHNTQKSCIDTKFSQLILLWQLLNSLFILLEQENLICWVITLQRNFCLERTEHDWMLHHIRSTRSFVKGFILSAHVCDCSVKTEWFAETIMRKMFPGRLHSETTVFRVLCFWAYPWTMELLHGKLDIHFQQIPPASFPRYGPKFLVDCLLS